MEIAFWKKCAHNLLSSLPEHLNYRGVLQPTVSTKCNIPTGGQVETSIMGSCSIYPHGFVLQNVIHLRPDECFLSPPSYAF